MSRSSVRVLVVMLGVMLASHGQTCADSKRRGAAIVTPKRNAEVGRTHEVVGKLEVPGQPVVLVKPHQPNEVWWIQPPPTRGERGLFKTEVRFGSATARRGDRFSLVVIVLQAPADIEYLRDRDSLPEVPETLWQSEETVVVLGEDAVPDRGPIELAAAVVTPRPDEQVARVTELTGRVFQPSRAVILVRVDNSAEFWWVQEPVVMRQDGYFHGTVHFGNDGTPHGTRFRVVVVTPRSEWEASLFRTGKTFAELPRGIPRSEEVVVQLARFDAAQVIGAP